MKLTFILLIFVRMLLAVDDAHRDSVPIPTDLRPKAGVEKGYNPEVFRTSVSFELYLEKEGFADTWPRSRATLVGLRQEKDGFCKFVFVTVAHAFAVPPNVRQLTRLTFATGEYLKDTRRIDFLAHPKYLYPGTEETAQYDVGLFSIHARCPHREMIRPFRVVHRANETECRIYSPGFLMNRPHDQKSERAKFRLDTNFQVKAEPEKKDRGFFLFKQDKDNRTIFKGHSGTGLFCLDQGECAWMGCIKGANDSGWVWAVGKNPEISDWVIANARRVTEGHSLNGRVIEVGRAFDSGISITPGFRWPTEWGAKD